MQEITKELWITFDGCKNEFFDAKPELEVSEYAPRSSLSEEVKMFKADESTLYFAVHGEPLIAGMKPWTMRKRKVKISFRD